MGQDSGADVQKRPPNSWDLRRQYKTARKFVSLLRICERLNILVLSSNTIGSAWVELPEFNSKGILMTAIYSQAVAGRIFEFRDSQTQVWEFRFRADYIQAVHAGDYEAPEFVEKELLPAPPPAPVPASARSTDPVAAELTTASAQVAEMTRLVREFPALVQAAVEKALQRQAEVHRGEIEVLDRRISALTDRLVKAGEIFKG